MNWYLQKHCLSKRIMTRHNIYSLLIRPSSLSYSHVKLQNQLTAQLYIHNTANTEHLKKNDFRLPCYIHTLNYKIRTF